MVPRGGGEPSVSEASMSLNLETVSVSRWPSARPRRESRSVTGRSGGAAGPNGAGKTTTFNLVVGLLRPDRGAVNLDGSPWPASRCRSTPAGYRLPAQANVFRQLSVRENLEIALAQTDLSSRERQDRRDQLIDQFHLPHSWIAAGIGCPEVNADAVKRPGLWRSAATTTAICCWMNPLPGSTRWRSPIFRH